MWRLLLLLSMLPCAAPAGPWLRGEGETYLFQSTELSRTEAAWLSLYAERGVHERLTLGLDAGGRADLDAIRALAFARLPVVAEGTWRAAVQIGLGADWDGTAATPALRLSASLGRGLDLLAGAWAAAEIGADLAPDLSWSPAAGIAPAPAPPPVAHLDAVLGLRVTDETAVTLGLRGHSESGWRLVPGYERRLGPVALGLSAVIDPEGGAPAALSLRTVLEF